MVKLELGECGCTIRGMEYCRSEDGVRFTENRCAQRGKKITRDN